MLITMSPRLTAVFFARMVMPFSRSRSPESITRSVTRGADPERAGLPEHGVDQGGLAMVDVRHDGHVAQVGTIERTATTEDSSDSGELAPEAAVSVGRPPTR